ncbi:MAG: hypothetical protein A2Y79_02290 [Deltaproteobacteria bacterium RBG_13_43_22]|nr:MAG: hypothetical protein A2Y79_02290 [Deltaproteobacteria bacterium RBG_13_43_22]
MSLTEFTFPLIMTKTASSWSGIERLREACLGLTLLEIETLFPIEGYLFTPREMEKVLKMGPRRRKSFTAARIALKDLSRQIGLIDESRPDHTIETLGSDNETPCLDQSGLYCSVSHSDRFVVAVAHRHPVGVDIEAVSNKIIRIRHLFLSPSEQLLFSQSTLDPGKTATRVWTIKEAAAKALGLHLFQAFREVEVIKGDIEKSVMTFEDKTYSVNHGEGDGQVISLVCCGEP